MLLSVQARDALFFGGGQYDWQYKYLIRIQRQQVLDHIVRKQINPTDLS
jgi:hypothetical protein